MTAGAAEAEVGFGSGGEAPGGVPVTGGRRHLDDLWAFTKANRGFAIGLAIVAISLVLMVVGPLIGPYDPNEEHPDALLSPPSAEYWFGTDDSGRDVFSRVLAAPRVDLQIAIVSTLLALVIGIPLGVLASGTTRAGAAFGELLMRSMDVLQAFPVFVLALALVAAAGPSARNIIIALTVLQFPVFLRLTRSAALTTRNLAYVEAARCAGASERRIVLSHVLPNSLSPALIAASVAVAQAILITAGLSFVGAGIRPPTAEWGAMISNGAQNMITGQWWPSLFPGLALGVTVLGFALVGDGLRRFSDPALR